MTKHYLLTNFFFSLVSLPLFAQFAPEILLDSFSSTNGFELADIDKDGRLDIVTYNINWHRQLDGVAFSAANYVGKPAVSLLFADLDGNGWTDIIANSSTVPPVWYPNQGNGVFNGSMQFLSDQASVLDLSDLDGDGDMDLILKRSVSSNNLIWLENTDGLGNFNSHDFTGLAISDALPYDLDGDGDKDLLVASGGNVKWLENSDGQANFGTAQTLITSASYISSVLELLDIDGDGDDDLIVHRGSTDKYWYKRTGTTSFAGNGGLAGITQYLEFADLNKDDFLDLVIFGEDQIYWKPQRGDHSFGNPITLHSSPNNRYGKLTDLNNDGIPDLVFMEAYQLLWLSNANKEAVNTDYYNYIFDPYSYLYSDIGDIDGDGLLDFVYSTGNAKYWRAQLPNKKVFSDRRLIADPVTIADIIPYNAVNPLKLVDWDMDSDLDLLVDEGRQVKLFRNNSGAGFGLEQVLIDTISNEYVLPGDFDNDGDMDIVGKEYNQPLTYLYRNDGQDHFVKQLIFSANVFRNMEAIDVGNDGDLDILLLDANFKLYYFENTGTTFENPIQIGTNYNISKYILAADFNQDGRVSVILYLGNGLYELKYNPSSQTFEHMGDFENITYSINSTGPLLTAKDMDNDGDLDFVYSKYASEEINWLQNHNGNFDTPEPILSNTLSTSQLYALDLDNDGDIDICTHQGGNLPSNTSQPVTAGINWYEKTPAGFSYQNGHNIAPDYGLEVVTYADFDLDGDLDVLGRKDTHVSWLENYDGKGSLATEKAIGLDVPLYNSNTDAHIYCFDLGGDGDMDLLWSQNGGGILYKNNGSAFLERNLFNNWFLDGAALEDINGDGHEDIIVFNEYDKWIKKLIQQPANGSFAPSVNITTMSQYISEIGFLDVDKDADQDLLVKTYDQGIYKLMYLLNNGSGSFGSANLLLDNVYEKSTITTADLNGDGFKDLVIQLKNANVQLVWYPVLGGSQFLGPEVIVAANTTASGTFVRDMDGDGDLDVVLDNEWFENVGNGQFNTIHELFDDTQFLSYENNAEVADFNADGIPDLLRDFGWLATNNDTLHGTNERLKTLMSLGYGTPSVVTIPFDVDLDGDLDLLLGRNNEISWMENSPIGGELNFKAAQPLMTVPKGKIFKLTAADMDQDGKKDLLFAASQSVGWYKHRPDHSFSVPITIQELSSTNEYTLASFGDLDDDNDIDFLLNTGTIFENLGQNSTLFNLKGASLGNTPLSHSIADLDGDGLKDIVYCLSGIKWRKNLGGFQFEAADTLYNIASSRQLRTLDIDQDGDMDILAPKGSSSNNSTEFTYLLLLKNDGNASSFSVDTLMSSYPNYSDLFFVTDVNNDYLMDIGYQSKDEEYLRWLVQNPDGSFADTILPAHTPLDFDNANLILPFDADGDFDNDLVYLKSGYKQIFCRENLQSNPVVSGQCFFDANQNALLDSTEITLLDVHTVLQPVELLSFPNNEGFTSYFVDLGDWELGYTIDSNLWQLTTGTEVYQISIDTLPFNANYKFGFYPKVDIVIMAPHLVSAPTRCNTVVPFWLSMKNNGTIPVNGQLKLVLDSLVTVDAADITPSSVSGDTLVWELSNFYPSYNKEIKLWLQMPDENSTGHQLRFETWACIPDAALDTVLNFKHEYAQQLRCSFDPNDKLVNPDRIHQFDENLTLFSEQLEYTIRFQNTGNDTAFHITLLDQLDSNLDWNTFKPLAASHYNETSLSDSGLLKVFFRNILLPDTATNEPASHGFFSYSIHPKAGLAENTVISNTANIYFDYNQAIVTNTTNNVLVSMLPELPSSEKEQQQRQGFKLYPNPVGVGRSLTVETPWANATAQLTDVYGRVWLEKIQIGRKSSLLLPMAASGLYFLSIENKGEQFIFKVLVWE